MIFNIDQEIRDCEDKLASLRKYKSQIAFSLGVYTVTDEGDGRFYVRSGYTYECTVTSLQEGIDTITSWRSRTSRKEKAIQILAARWYCHTDEVIDYYDFYPTVEELEADVVSDRQC